MPYLPPRQLCELNPAKLPTYHKPASSIQLFHEEFPLPTRLFRKWKDGIKIWSSKKFAKKYKDIVTTEKTAVLNELLSKDIIIKTKKGPFISDFFLLEGKEKIRPIFNYSQLTKSLNPPKFFLPSLYQIIKKRNWQENLYFIKLDFKQAFFNLNINPKSAYLTTFIYNKNFYKFNVLPFGIANAPFAAQMCLNQVTKFIQSYTKYVWGHIDDIIRKKLHLSDPHPNSNPNLKTNHLFRILSSRATFWCIKYRGLGLVWVPDPLKSEIY